MTAINLAVHSDDSHGDGKTDDDDTIVSTMARPDGRAYRTLSAPVNRIISRHLLPDGYALGGSWWTAGDCRIATMRPQV